MPTSIVTCAGMLKAISDESRLEIIRLLMKGPSHVGALNVHLRIEQSLLSHHLRLLRESGLVTAKRDGKAVLYRISDEAETRRSGQVLNLGCCKIDFNSGETSASSGAAAPRSHSNSSARPKASVSEDSLP